MFLLAALTILELLAFEMLSCHHVLQGAGTRRNTVSENERCRLASHVLKFWW